MNDINETILIVDDTLQNITLMEAILNPLYITKTAFSAQEALQIIEKHKPSLILLDVVMPDMSGYDLCRQLKSNPETRNIPIIFVTCRDQVDDETLGFSLGAVDYIHKPINISTLKARIKTHLFQSHLLNAIQKDCTHIIEREKNTQKESKQKIEIAKLAIENSRTEVIKHLARAAEFKDNETGFHVQRVGRYSHLLAQKVINDIDFADMIFEAALMHDIGKIGIPDHILLKQGRLTPDELDIMRTHAEIGAAIIEPNQPGVLGVAYNIALNHHEKWDGSGYPAGLKGEDIPIEGRIVAIVDVFDALTSERPYKKSWSIDDAVQLLVDGKGTHFDSHLVTEFVKILPQIIEVKEKYSDNTKLNKEFVM